MSWVYDVFSVTTFSALLGVLEIAAAALIAVKTWWPTFSMAGSPPENPESGVRGRGSGNEGAKEGVGGFLNRAQSE